MSLAADGRVRPAASGPTLATGLATLATLGAAATVMLVSSIALTAAGVPYGSTEGSLVTKIHPATYLAAVALLFWSVATGGAGRFAATLAARHTGIAVLAVMLGLLLFHAVVVVRVSISPIADTFALTVFLLAAMVMLGPAPLRLLEAFVHVVMIANGLLGIFEYLTGFRLIPLYENDGVTVMSYDWRSSALFGHPLSNAFQTGAYLVALACGATPRLPVLARLAFMAISALALIGFGGRTAMVVSYTLTLAIGGFGGARLLAGRRFRIGHAALAVGFVTAAAIAAILFVDAGGADRFVDRFDEDHGSAQTRVSMLRVFGTQTWEQFLLWPDGSLIEQAQREYSLRIGIESSEVGLVATYGVVVAGLLLLAIGAFLAELVRATAPATLWTIVYFVVVMSASNGIAVKTTNFATFVVTVFAVMPHLGAARRKSRGG